MQRGTNQPQQGEETGYGRTAPQGMPREVASHSRAPKQIEQKRDILPTQRPITDDPEQPKPPSKIIVFLKKAGLAVLLVIALCMAYIFLLLGEPERTADVEIPAGEEIIRVPMAAMESAGEANVSAVVSNFGKPVLALYSNALPLQKVSLSDTAFQGGYARRTTLLYTFADGQVLKLESIRPTTAAGLLYQSGSSLHVGNLYSLAGLEAARMDDKDSVCLFAKGDGAVYAITCPSDHIDDLGSLMKQTTLLGLEMAQP